MQAMVAESSEDRIFEDGNAQGYHQPVKKILLGVSQWHALNVSVFFEDLAFPPTSSVATRAIMKSQWMSTSVAPVMLFTSYIVSILPESPSPEVAHPYTRHDLNASST